jgi:hypothetical protein
MRSKERAWLRYSLEEERERFTHISYLRFASLFLTYITQKVLLFARERRIGTLISASPCEKKCLCPLFGKLARERERERKARLRERKKKNGEHASAIGDSWEEMRPLQHAHDAVMA